MRNWLVGFLPLPSRKMHALLESERANADVSPIILVSKQREEKMVVASRSVDTSDNEHRYYIAFLMLLHKEIHERDNRNRSCKHEVLSSVDSSKSFGRFPCHSIWITATTTIEHVKSSRLFEPRDSCRNRSIMDPISGQCRNWDGGWSCF